MGVPTSATKDSSCQVTGLAALPQAKRKVAAALNALLRKRVQDQRQSKRKWRKADAA